MDAAFYKRFARPLLFKMDPEQAHKLIHSLIHNSALFRPVLRKTYAYEGTDLASEVFGHKLNNPVGLAAGFDKNGDLVSVLDALGFGFAEVGSVTAQARPGNPRPRLFRLVEDEAVINRMGLNGEGADAIAAKMAATKFSLPVAVNIAKTNDPAITGDAAVADMVTSFERLKDLPVIFASINCSCPNTKEGVLTEVEQLRAVYKGVQAVNHRKIPLLAKLSPDSSEDFVGQIVAVAAECGLSGFVCGNTSTSRDSLKTDATAVSEIGNGGLSGKPIKNKALDLCRRVNNLKKPEQIIIGCGGIMSGQDAFEFLQAGASLIEIYTGLVYEGPGLALAINQQLSNILRQNNLTLQQAIGSQQEKTSQRARK